MPIIVKVKPMVVSVFHFILTCLIHGKLNKTKLYFFFFYSFIFTGRKVT